MSTRSLLRFTGALAALAPSVALAVPRWRAEIGVAGYTGTAPLTNFPVLVRLSETAVSGFRYADCAADGADFAFPRRWFKLRLVDDLEGPVLSERRLYKPNFTIPAMAAALDGGDLGLFQPFGYFWRYGHCK